MTINYIKKKIKLHANGETKDKYVAKIQYTGDVNEENIALDIARATTASESEVGMYIRELEYFISKYLSEGYIVRLNSLGTFYPTIHAKAQDSAKDVTHRTITRRGVLFRPSETFQKTINQASLNLATTKVVKATDHRKKSQ